MTFPLRIIYRPSFLDRLTSSTPRRPYERERLDQELRICGEFGLRCKREIWRVQLVLAKIRKVGIGSLALSFRQSSDSRFKTA